MSSILDTKADWVRIAEAAYPTTETDEGGASGVLDAFRGVMLAGPVSVMSAAFCEGSEPVVRFYAGEMYRNLGFQALTDALRADPAAVDAFFFPPSIVNTHSSLDRRVSPSARRMMETYRAYAGIADALGTVVSAVPGESTVIFAGSTARISVGRAEADLLTRAALHVEAALRARRRPETIRAVLDPSGKIVHFEPGAPARERLVVQARRIERARSRRTRRTPEALELWTTLVDGRASLVERFDGGKRYYLVLDNRAERRPMRALTRGEISVVSDAARGLSGSSSPTVTAFQRRAFLRAWRARPRSWGSRAARSSCESPRSSVTRRDTSSRRRR
ncbi:MAG: hypothetical protein IPJ34_15520 [Myxococcales bacterium]|nr:hypothetical protein [Myxococcales bacterium]